MLKVDTSTLTDVINQCFDYSMDGRFDLNQQSAFLAEGKRLRGLLLNLLSAQFDDATPAVLKANKQLDAVNTSLSDATAVLAKTVQTLNEIAALVGNLDKLLNVAASFI
jgi:hypothetical protein